MNGSGTLNREDTPLNRKEWEKEQQSQLENDINNAHLQEKAQDTLLWLADQGGIYIVKSPYVVLQQTTTYDLSLALDTVWVVKALPNALILA
ncbi:hypothetical protein ACSQ67_014039 [Phaseolus vulgaris]